MNVFKSFKNLGSDWFRNTVADPDHFGTYVSECFHPLYIPKLLQCIFFSFFRFLLFKKIGRFYPYDFLNINQLVIITNL